MPFVYVFLHTLGFAVVVHLNAYFNLREVLQHPVALAMLPLFILTCVLYTRLVSSNPGRLCTKKLDFINGDPSTRSDFFVCDGESEVRGIKKVWCDECKTMLPLRAAHCSVCARCCSTFDHHCGWIGNCVGGGNHALFNMFLYCELALLVSAACLLAASVSQQSAGRWRVDVSHSQSTDLRLRIILTGVACACLSLFALFVLRVATHHTFVAVANITSRELLRPGLVPYYQQLLRRRNGLGDLRLGSLFDEGPRHNLRLFFARSPPIEWSNPRLKPEQERSWVCRMITKLQTKLILRPHSHSEDDPEPPTKDDDDNDNDSAPHQQGMIASCLLC